MKMPKRPCIAQQPANGKRRQRTRQAQFHDQRPNLIGSCSTECPHGIGKPDVCAARGERKYETGDDRNDKRCKQQPVTARVQISLQK